MPSVRFSMTSAAIRIKDGRHPLLDPKKVVPVTVRLGDDFRLLIITGPNTGGKNRFFKDSRSLYSYGTGRSSHSCL